MKAFTLGPGEQVVAIFRKHSFFMWLAGLKYLVLAIIPPIALQFVSSYITLGTLAQIAFITYLIILWVMFFIEWTNYMLDTWILTSERLVDIEQVALFTRRVSTLSLDRIQDVTFEQHGIFETFFGFGMILIQTAGEEHEFRMPMMRDPAQVKDIILQTYQGSKDRIFERIADLR